MSRRAFPRLVLMLAGIGAGLLGHAPAWAGCPDNAGGLTVTVTPSPTVSSYDPGAAGDTTRPLSVTVRNNSGDPCIAGVSFKRALGASATMTNEAATLQYGLERSGGNSLITQTGYVQNVSPAAANRLSFTVGANSTSAPQTVTLRVPAGQNVAAGSYTDLGVVLQLMELQSAGGSPVQLIRETSFTPLATVAASCTLPAPSPPNLSLTSAISQGLPNAAVTASTTFTGVRCSAPTRVRLSGAALLPSPALSARPSFDNFINWHANAQFGAAKADLTTTGTAASPAGLATVTSANKNIASGVTTNGTISVTANLVAGQRILAGSYAGTLTVSIDPSF